MHAVPFARCGGMIGCHSRCDAVSDCYLHMQSLSGTHPAWVAGVQANAPGCTTRSSHEAVLDLQFNTTCACLHGSCCRIRSACCRLLLATEHASCGG